MNCKEGDLAVVASSKYGVNVGKLLTVIRLATFSEIEEEMPGSLEHGPIWRTDRPMTWKTSSGKCCDAFLAPDSRLRPVRDNDGEDQTLTWAGKPSDIKTKEAA